MMIAVALLLQAVQSAAPAQPTTVKAAPPKMICRTVGTTGSRLGGKRVCASKADWDAREFNDRQTTERMSANTISDRGL
ncbi:hypothetical protein [Sphingomonas rubra]|uniref:Secreted protein n=1 Tax=Sphingomonas rubra TaxID=634430 RepID=A0A1I5QT54_9SPHN|nr:hypothetical protein [Sphingomonas rubra]SFP49439.1 hypothetical protein SAMN04488241_102268 [Sphingomonas rubra]